MPDPDGPGKIYSLDLQDPRLKPLELRVSRNFDLDSFNPHGISAYVSPSGKCPYLNMWNIILKEKNKAI